MSRIPGEHYKTRVDLAKLLQATIYPMLDQHLDVAFPEFDFVRGTNGWWVAQSAPVNYAGYGYREGRLIARGWGFRSSKPGMPAQTWLAYVNKRIFPSGPAFINAVRNLAGRIHVTCDDWDYEPREVYLTELVERRDRLLEAFFAFTQGALYGPEGIVARNFLTKVGGLPPNTLWQLDVGFYTTSEDVRQAVKEAGFDTPDDTNRGEVLGIFHPRWEGRVVGPWWDQKGQRVINMWGRFPGPTPLDSENYINLFRPDFSQPFGSKEVPVGMHHAVRLRKNRLVILESPLKAILAQSLGLTDPYPISTGGIPTVDQAEVLSKYLKRAGAVILNFDYDPMNRDPHGRSVEAVRSLQAGGTFPLFVVDPIEMCGSGSHTKEMCPARFIRANGIQGYRALLSKRVPASNYLGHANVLEYRGPDRKDEETPKELIEGIEAYIDELDEQQRGLGVDTLNESLTTSPEPEMYSLPPSHPGPVIQAEELGARVDSGDELQALLQNLGGGKISEQLLADLIRVRTEAGARVSSQVDMSAEQIAVPTDGNRPGADSKGKRNIDLMAANIQKGFEKIARDVSRGEVTSDQAILILLKCHEGIQTILSSMYEKILRK